MEENNFSTLEGLTKTADENYIKLLKENRLQELLRAIGYFKDFSIKNDVLILTQMPEATLVNTFEEWNSKKRRVKEQQHSIRVVSNFIKKSDLSYTDKYKNIHLADTNIETGIGHLFDISQTQGEEYPYLNANKENIAKHFEAAKKGLERIPFGYKFEYVNQDENSKIDWEHKTVYIKDGLSINDVINELVNNVAEIVLSTRNATGLENKNEFEKNCVVYAVSSKLGLDLPNYDFSVSNLTDEEMGKLEENLQKVRSVTSQILSNFETSMEIAVRNLQKKMEESEKTNGQQKTQQYQKKYNKERTTQNESEVQ